MQWIIFTITGHYRKTDKTRISRLGQRRETLACGVHHLVAVVAVA